MPLHLLRHEGAMIGLGVVELQIDDEIIDLDEGTDYSRHELELLQKRVLADLVEAQ